jgi:hypothetical protein
MSSIDFPIYHAAENLNQALGISDERRDEMQEPFKNLILNQQNDDAVKEINLLDLLEGVKGIAQTPGELVFLCFNLEPAIQQVTNPLYRAMMQVQDEQNS